MEKIIDGKAIAADIREEIAADVAALKEQGGTPGLAGVLVGVLFGEVWRLLEIGGWDMVCPVWCEWWNDQELKQKCARARGEDTTQLTQTTKSE